MINNLMMTIGNKNSYEVPKIAGPSLGFVLGAGDVAMSGIKVSTPPIYMCSTTTAVLSVLVAGAVTQGFIDETGTLLTRQVARYGAFPENSIPLFEVAANAEGLITDLVDRRKL